MDGKAVPLPGTQTQLVPSTATLSVQAAAATQITVTSGDACGNLVGTL